LISKEPRELLKKAGLREKVKIIIGRAPVYGEFAQKVGADAYGKDAFEGLNICKAWILQKNDQRSYP